MPLVAGRNNTTQYTSMVEEEEINQSLRETVIHTTQKTPVMLARTAADYDEHSQPNWLRRAEFTETLLDISLLGTVQPS